MLLKQAPRKKYIERYLVTTRNEDVEIAYVKLIDRDILGITEYEAVEDLVVVVNLIDIKK